MVHSCPELARAYSDTRPDAVLGEIEKQRRHLAHGPDSCPRRDDQLAVLFQGIGTSPLRKECERELGGHGQ